MKKVNLPGINWVSDYDRMKLKHLLQSQSGGFFSSLIAHVCDWELLRVVLRETNELAKTQRDRDVEGKRERERGDEIRYLSVKLLSSPAAPFEHQSSISICVTDTSYKIET